MRTSSNPLSCVLVVVASTSSGFWGGGAGVAPVLGRGAGWPVGGEDEQATETAIRNATRNRPAPRAISPVPPLSPSAGPDSIRRPLLGNAILGTNAANKTVPETSMRSSALPETPDTS